MLKVIYSIILFPLIFIVFALASIFSKKISKGFLPRFQTITSLRKWYQANQQAHPVIMYHAASLGEFEHIKPLFLKLKQLYQVTNIVTLFSPSGVEHARMVAGVDRIMYMPFDTLSNWRRIYELLRPKMIIISKHDVWPAQIWKAVQKKIPVFLVNASLGADSSRIRPPVVWFLKSIYQLFTCIYAISQEDAQRFIDYFKVKRIIVTGDTKYDQVIYRKEHGTQEALIAEAWYQNKWIFINGSVWPEDLDHIIPACTEFLNLQENIKIIIAPHQPEARIVNSLTDTFNEWGVAKFSANNIPEASRVLIIDGVGYLATLYKYAKAAYVGGSFSQGIHNVMEAAIYGIPVLYGPRHTNSYEAIQLAKNSGGIVIRSAAELFTWLQKFYKNNNERLVIGNYVLDYVKKNTGTTDRLVNNLRIYLEEEAK